MRFSLPVLRRLSEALRRRDWFGILFELVVVVIGVMLGMAASRWSAESDERRYKHQIVAALDTSMRDFDVEGQRIVAMMDQAIGRFERDIKAGKRPPPPIIYLPGMERPPTRAWEALVATGIAKSLNTQLIFRLAIFFDQADSFGDKYQRYHVFTEREILPYREAPARFYGPDGKLLPLYREHVDWLVNLRAFAAEMSSSAKDIRKLLRRADDEPQETELKELPLET